MQFIDLAGPQGGWTTALLPKNALTRVKLRNQLNLHGSNIGAGRNDDGNL